MLSTARMAVAALSLGLTVPAVAGECPADQCRANQLSNAPTDPVGVSETVIGAVDLGTEIGVKDRQLRTRRLVIQPGGVVPLHSHADRPALIVTVSGQVTEHRSSCAVPIVHRAGEISREADGISHYWTNDGRTPAVLLSSDVFHAK